MTQLEEVLAISQKCLSEVPVIVLGSGASIPYGLGSMDTLSQHLLKTIQPSDDKEKAIWDAFSILLKKHGNLEIALTDVQLLPSLEKKVIEGTRNLILSGDQMAFNKFLNNELHFSLSRLINYLLETTHNKISIVTTNYDRLAEYATEALWISHDTGFSEGYFRPFSSTFKLEKKRKTVEILKVHGSIDWFIDSKGGAYALPDCAKVPKEMRPLLVTPGIGKYQATHEEPFRSIITRSDEAFEGARGILCIGYGFNDQHIQPKLNKRVNQSAVPIVILTKKLSESAKEFLANCKNNLFLALEQNENSTTAYLHKYRDGVDLPNVALWKLDEFLTNTILAS